MQHIDEGTIHAWLDGALDAEESARVEQHVASCAACASAVAEARGLVAGSTRILAALDDVPAGVAPRRGDSLGSGGASTQRRPRSLWTFLHMTPARAAAAAFVIVAVGTVFVMQHQSEPIARQTQFQTRATLGARPAASVPATPLPAPTATDSLAVARNSARKEVAPARAGSAGGAEANSSASVVAAAPPLPVPTSKPVMSRNADASEKRSLNLSQVVVTASVDTAKATPTPAARALTDTYQRKVLSNAQAAEAAPPSIVGGVARPGSAMPARAFARLPASVNYSGCYSVATRGDSLASIPRLLSLDSARFSPTQLFAVSTITDAGRRPIDTASWEPMPSGIRVFFGQTPINLRSAADSTLATIRGEMTLRRVDCRGR